MAVLQEELAIRHLADFVQLFWPIAVPQAKRCIWGPHMQAVCEELEALVRESDRRRIVEEEIHETEESAEEAALRIEAELGVLPRLRLVINIPPRHSKSAIISKLFQAWRWLCRPQEQVIALAAAETLIERDGLALRRVVTSPEYQQVSARVRASLGLEAWGLRHDQNAKKKFDTTEGGTRQGFPVGGKFTGADADGIIIDDPHDVDEAMKGTTEQIAKRMMEVRNFYIDKVQDRLNSEFSGYIILIMQRLHDDDLADYMIEQGAAVVCLPSEYAPSHPNAYEAGSQWHPDSAFDESARFPYTHDGDWRVEPGELLNPSRFPISVLRRKREESPVGYAAKHDQRPTPLQGNQIRREFFSERYRAPVFQIASTADEVWISSDAAKKAKKTSDFHAIQVWARKGAQYYLLDRIHERMTYPTYQQTMDDLHERWATWRSATLIEDTANGTTYLQCRRASVPNLIPFHPNTDTPGKDKSKGARAVYLERAAEARQILLPAASKWTEAFIAEVCAFPDGAHDDDVDAASQIIMRWVRQEAGGTSYENFFASLGL
jgi:predicted phage terminase large subunit-like protein